MNAIDKKREKLQKKLDKYQKLYEFALQDRESSKDAKSALVQSHVQIRAYQETIDQIEAEIDGLDPAGDLIKDLPDEEIIASILDIVKQLPEQHQEQFERIFKHGK